MSNRKVKDAIDLTTGEKIYFKSHAASTFMNSGKSIEEAINEIPDLILQYVDDDQTVEELENLLDLSKFALKTDLLAKQDKISDIDAIRSGAALGATALQSYTEKYTGTYSKPVNGIPKSDLTSTIQASLSKADTAIQSENLKTFNGESLVGAGDIEVKVDMSDVLMWEDSNITADDVIPDGIPVIEFTTYSITLEPNKYYRTGTVAELSIELAEPTYTHIQNEYVVTFTSGETPTNLSLPISVKWCKGDVPVIESNTTYTLSIVDNLGMYAAFPLEN